jgi:dolichol-phosphate mannosyltransferase
MHARVVGVCAELGCGYEIVFVVDGSPDASADRVLEISRVDPRVRGICHARNFGSQAAFLSGMSVASGDAVVLLDGDLQDPPEVAREMILAWRRGAQLVLARRVGRDAPAAMRFAYRAFYRLLSRLSPYPIPRDVGDFCLMTREVYRQVTQMSEREPFIRVMRAYLGFRATTVDYYRPRRKYGRSTNSLLRNLQWAVSGFLAASRRPLTLLGVAGAVLVALSIVGLLYQALVRFLNPSITPRGLTTVLLVVGTFGAMNLLATAVVGAYVGRVLEQTRHRPRFVVESLIADGKRRLSPAPVSSR